MVLLSTSCFDAVILAEIVISGSEFMTNFDKIFLSYFNRFDFLVFTFCFMVLFQDNHKLKEARFL